jgi:hypothetical protein
LFRSIGNVIFSNSIRKNAINAIIAKEHASQSNGCARLVSYYYCIAKPKELNNALYTMYSGYRYIEVLPTMPRPKKQKQIPSYHSLVVSATVKKWPSGGCYASVPKDWIDHSVIISLPDKTLEDKVHGLGKDQSHAYVARIPCELAGQEIIIELKDRVK